MSIKLCSDCAHYKVSQTTNGVNNFDKCSNPEYTTIDLVRGNHKLKYCEELRMTLGNCGPDGRGFTYNPGSPVEPGVDEHEL